jgi:hypothetical protein
MCLIKHYALKVCGGEEPKDTHTEYVIFLAFPQQQWLRERASMLRYTYIACLVLSDYYKFVAVTLSNNLCQFGVTIKEIYVVCGLCPVKLYFALYVAGYAMMQLVEALRFKPEGRCFDSPWCHWNFSLI